MTRKRTILCGFLTVLAALLSAAQYSRVYAYEEGPMHNEQFLEQNFTAVDSSTTGRRSMFSWDLFFLNNGAFPALSELLTAYEIDRVYQDIPQVYFSQKELPAMVDNFSKRGIQIVALNGDRRWVEDGLDEYKSWIDSLVLYNQVHQTQPINAVALDVESYTLSSFKKDPAAGFAAYVQCMEQAYQYAHERGLWVIQVIPTKLDTIDCEQFEWFVSHCCDEISIMNYRKDVALASIWDEVLICRRLGVPVETIFETMPLNDYFGVTEEKTYYYEGKEALAAAVDKMQSVYGTSLGIAYHYARTMFHLNSGLHLVELYPYGGQGFHPDRNGQVSVGEQICLLGEDGSIVDAWLYNPNLAAEIAEYCYLAVGVQADMNYTILLDDPDVRVSAPKRICIQGISGKVLYTKSFRVIK